MTNPMYNQELFDKLVAERGVGCELCWYRLAVHLHHCIVHRKKGHPEYDVPANLELVCQECHDSGIPNSYEHRVVFWAIQKGRGYDMQGWYDSLNLKKKERFE